MDRREVMFDSGRSFLGVRGEEAPSKQHSGQYLGGSDTRPPLDRNLQSFYYHIYTSHPFVLPQSVLGSFVQDVGLQPVLAAMRWLGSLFSDSESLKFSLFEDASMAVRYCRRRQNGFQAQAMMLLVIGLDAIGKQDEAIKMLNKAKRMAVEIGLHTKNFSRTHGRGICVLEESWRRTWWELYILDGMFASVHRAHEFTLFNVHTDAGLPCEEGEYSSLDFPARRHMHGSNDRYNDGSSKGLTSFAYRVLSIRNLGTLLNGYASLRRDEATTDSLEALLSKWTESLPTYKRDCLQKNGEPDEMMYQARLITHTTYILLFQPQLRLFAMYSRERAVSGPSTYGLDYNSSQDELMRSATSISEMVTQRTPIRLRTHFFTWTLVLSSLVHVSTWSMGLPLSEDEKIRQLIRLNIGALRQLSRRWDTAACALIYVEEMVRDVYVPKKQTGSVTVGHASAEGLPKAGELFSCRGVYSCRCSDNS